MPAPSSSLISTVLGDLAGLPEADRDALADRIPQLIAHLAWVPDPRDPRGVRHSLTSLLATAVAAVLTGATSFTAIEFVHRQHFTTRAEARIKVATWIADFYNTSRRHSANDGLAPITFESQMAEARRASTAQLKAEVA